jgi:hypothetical protein
MKSALPQPDVTFCLRDASVIDELRRSAAAPARPEVRARSTPARPIPGPLIQDLQGLRQLVIERLDSLETLAQKRRASTEAVGEVAVLERTFKQKLAELEETQHRLRSQAEREEQDWRAALAQLDSDRRLLAEAWERVERQRIEFVSAAQVRPQLPPPAQIPQMVVQPQLPHIPSPIPTRSTTADSDPSNPVAQAILRQFQTLCSDVRRNADGRRACR